MMTWQTKIIIYPLNGYQFWQGGHIEQVASFDHVVLQGHYKQKTYDHKTWQNGGLL